MHTSRYAIDEQLFTVHHNGDWSGDLKIRFRANLPVDPDNPELSEKRVVFEKEVDAERAGVYIPEMYTVTLPNDLVRKIVADQISEKLISALERLDSEDILGLFSSLLQEA